MIRTCLTLLAICLYTFCVNLYIYELTHSYWLYDTKRAFYNAFSFLMLIYYMADRYNGFNGWFHRKFNEVIILVIAVNNLLWFMNWIGVLGDAEHPQAIKLFFAFNGSVFVTTTMFLVAGIRHKTFKMY